MRKKPRKLYKSNWLKNVRRKSKMRALYQKMARNKSRREEILPRQAK